MQECWSKLVRNEPNTYGIQLTHANINGQDFANKIFIKYTIKSEELQYKLKLKIRKERVPVVFCLQCRIVHASTVEASYRELSWLLAFRSYEGPKIDC